MTSVEQPVYTLAKTKKKTTRRIITVETPNEEQGVKKTEKFAQRDSNEALCASDLSVRFAKVSAGLLWGLHTVVFV